MSAGDVTRVLSDDGSTDLYGSAGARTDGPPAGDDATRILSADEAAENTGVGSRSANAGPSSSSFATTTGPLSAPLADLLKARLGHGEGARLARYALLRILGEGGMGVVFAAYDEELDRRVAIKLLRTPSHGSAIDRAWILDEAKAMAKLSHPNVVQIYDLGEV
ncbi:MAG: protein kinase, partial [Myxococcales bacterium]|nr:protein kinase [Myxococcales bacterium]